MANSVGSAAKSSSRRCFTLVRVATPPAPRTPLPTKFAVAEKHMAGLLPCKHTITHGLRALTTPVTRRPVCSHLLLTTARRRIGGHHEEHRAKCADVRFRRNDARSRQSSG